jgi:hypothetical protein
MKSTTQMRALLLTSLVANCNSASAQLNPTAQGGVIEALSGTAAPLTLKLKDLNGSWRRVTPGVEPTTTNMSSAIVSMMTGEATPYFTEGKTVALGSTLYLVAYSTPRKSLDLAALQKTEEMPKADPLTPDTMLELSLFNLTTMGSISGIRPFDLAAETAAPTPSGLLEMFAGARDKARAASSINNLKQLGIAMQMYTQDSNESFPPMTTADEMKKALFPYVKSDGIFTQPGKDTPYAPNPWLSKKKLATIKQPAAIVVLFEAEPGDDDMVGLLFADWHVKRVPPAEAATLKKASHVP